MIESRRGMIIVAAIALSFTILFLVLQVIPEGEKYSAAQDQISLLSINPVNVRSVTTRYDDIVHGFMLNEGEWYMDGEVADYNATDLRVTCISYLYSDNLVTDSAEELSIYGLDAPIAEASFETFDDECHSVVFGIESIDGSSRYMMLDGNGVVYTIPEEVFEVIFDEEEDT